MRLAASNHNSNDIYGKDVYKNKRLFLVFFIFLSMYNNEGIGLDCSGLVINSICDCK